MSSLDTSPPAVPRSLPAQPVALRKDTALQSMLLGYLELSKPRIAVVSLVTVAIGFLLGSQGSWQPVMLLHALAGIALVATASSAFNQLFEITTDQKMKRTASRPLPSGVLTAREVLLFASATGVGGVCYLAWQVNSTTAILALATCLIYAGCYTPLKCVTSLCTTVGAVAGALPPVLGWTAAGGALNSGALSLFAILFVWQFPHFLAIAWLYRQEYKQAGLQMIPKAAEYRKRVVGTLAVGYALVLIPVSLLPAHAELAGRGYTFAAAILGMGYLFCTARFAWNETKQTARDLIRSSLLYLPALLLVMLWDHWRLLH